MTLTELLTAVHRLPSLPANHRRAAAAALADVAGHVLADRRIAEATALTVWTRLACAVAPTTPAAADAAAARGVALAVLGIEEDALAPVRAARHHASTVTAQLASARAQLHTAAVTAVRTGAPVAAVAGAADVARQTLYDWLED